MDPSGVRSDPVPTESPAPEGDGRSPGSRFPGPGAALAIYLVLTILLTWPLAAHLGDRLPAGDNDLWQNAWNFWWWKTALLERGQSPYHTDLLYQPGEVSLAFHTHSEANILSTFPVVLAAGAPAALNVATLLGFLLAAWGGYLLALEIVGCRAAAFLAGLVLGYFPHHFEQSLEHLNLASYQAMPFFLLFLVRLVRRGGWGNVALVALTFALNCLYSWHNGLIVLPLAAVLFVVETARGPRPRARVVLEAAVAGAASALLVLPFLWPMAREILAGETYFLKPPVQKGIDPLFLLVPAAEHPLWGGWFAPLYEGSHEYASAGFTCYLGIPALALAVLAVLLAARSSLRRRWLLWAGLLVGYLTLALGDPLVIGGRELRMPFGIVRELPLLKTLRVANRFVIPAMIPLAVLAAAGAREILGATRGRARGIVLSALAAVLVIDFLWLPYPTRPVPEPAWTREVAKCSPGLLLDVPGSYRAREAEDMYLQTLHHRPLVGGYTSCIPPSIEERVKRLPFLQLVFEGRPQREILEHAEEPALLEADIRETLAGLPIAVVVLHLERTKEILEKLQASHDPRSEARLHNPEKGIPARTLAAIREILERLWGRPCYEDASVVVFGRPEAR